MTGRRSDPVGVDAVHSENFPVALRILPARLRADLLAAYRYARYVDDVGDAASGDRAEQLAEVADDVRRLYNGQQPVRDEVAGLAPVIDRCALPIDPLLRLVDANMKDQEVSRYETFDDLLGYCRLSANPVGQIVLQIFDAASPDRIELSDRICTGLQLVEHWQDVAEDYRAGRIYLPARDREQFDVAEQDLEADHASPALRTLVEFETDRALAWINAGAPLVSTLRGWGRIAVSGYVAGGRAAAMSLRRAGYDPLTSTPKPTPRQMATEWLTGIARRPG
ncbi:squalene synthase HpnC [Antricoccus suffuscus]|uniref:Squalene synthase HpnC n=1 Tax=Antricoccus suffuscus TaxID=1629062 RepID=A0A2T0ZXL8_9ACTN|nr:squalene synthase HpnC [Antricoccus suffuscus]PRZ41083.1 squalene synthase HpnC [Antricoccus suffuscus]